MTQSTEESPGQTTGSPQLLPNLSAGLITGLVQVFLALSYAALIFSGELSPYVSQGAGLALLGTAIIGLVIAAFTSLPGVTGGSQGVPAAITALMAAAIVQDGGSTGEPLLESFATIVALIAIVVLLTGLFFWLLGRFHLGGLVRFLPYPVVGGLLAGVGWLFVTGAIRMMVDSPFSAASVASDASLTGNLSTLFQPELLAQWLPGLGLAVIMLMVLRRSDHYLILPAFLVGSALLFFLVARLGGYSPAELTAGGWLLGPFSGGAVLWQPSTALAMLPVVNWPAIAGQAGNIIAVMAISAITLLLNAENLELATGRDMDVNHELRIAGVANMLAGLAPGLVGYKQLSLSTLNFKLGGNSHQPRQARLPGLVAAVICLLALVASPAILAYVPKVVIGSLLFLLGLNFLYEWVFMGWFKLPKIDYAIVLAILLVTMVAGFLEGVVLGLLLTVIMFVISYSQVDVVRHELRGKSYRSRVIRARQQEQVLRREGNRLYILQLQGFIFFGTANNLLNQIRESVNDPGREKPDFVVLDFQRVAGLDSTAMLSFTRMKQVAEKEGFTLVFSRPNERVLGQLQQSDLVDDAVVRIFESLDQALESCENLILDEAVVELDEAPPLLADQLLELLSSGIGAVRESPSQSEPPLQDLLDNLEKLDVDAGQVLVRMGDRAEDLFFIESGQVTAQLTRPGRPSIRLETMGRGSVIGEIGFYLGLERTADVVSDEPGTVYRLSLEEMKDLEKTNPEAASVLHQVVIYLLAERVVRLTQTVQALER